MNVLFICDEYPPGRNGGIGTMVQVLGRELVRQGHNVFVMGLYAFSYGQKDYEEDQGVKVFRYRYGMNFGTNDRNISYRTFNKLPNFIKQRCNGKKAYVHFIHQINELIITQKIDVIEIQDWNSFAFNIGFSVSWPQFSAPLVVKSNGSYTYFSDETKVIGKPEYLAMDKRLYERADALSSVSKYTASVNDRLFKPNKPVEILYNCIDIPKSLLHEKSIGRKSKTIIFTGTLTQKKGIFSLMKAWNMVHQKYPDAELKIYGKGNILPLQNLLSDGAKSSVHFLGHVSRSELNNELSSATAAIFPSYSECFALAPLEALAVGCPVINTSRASGKELIEDGVNGSLIDPDNIEGIADTIAELIENPALQEKYSENGRKTIFEKFIIEKSAGDHVRYYQAVVDKSVAEHE